MNTGTCINANNSKRTVMVFISADLIDFNLKVVNSGRFSKVELAMAMMTTAEL